jgi:hypothetical protein
MQHLRFGFPTRPRTTGTSSFALLHSTAISRGEWGTSSSFRSSACDLRDKRPPAPPSPHLWSDVTARALSLCTQALTRTMRGLLCGIAMIMQIVSADHLLFLGMRDVESAPPVCELSPSSGDLYDVCPMSAQGCTDSTDHQTKCAICGFCTKPVCEKTPIGASCPSQVNQCTQDEKKTCSKCNERTRPALLPATRHHRAKDAASQGLDRRPR